ncbi:MAG TPA: MogA/MoaB family molybdenum cofactor biosynthesis protein [Actinomycetota bacterium]|nr:MogA/MoaB family molybdenum cofactor biosynthesis protein [Actinomycetota bacterium]
MRAVVITVSDRSVSGERADTSGPRAVESLRAAGFEVHDAIVVPDEVEPIIAALRDALASGPALIVTTGGTGLGVRDVTPEATRAVVDREIPGIAEMLRAEGRGSTPLAALSRGIAGTAGASLIVNLPGSPAAVGENLDVLLPLVPHALQVLGGLDPH